MIVVSMQYTSIEAIARFILVAEIVDSTIVACIVRQAECEIRPNNNDYYVFVLANMNVQKLL